MTTTSNVNFALKIVEAASEWTAKVNKLDRFRRIWGKFRDYIRAVPVNPILTSFASPGRFRESETLLLLAIQRESFLPELQLLLRKGVFSPTDQQDFGNTRSRLKNFNPFLGTDTLLRAGTRLEHATLDYDTKYPIILSADSPHVRSLIRYEHEVSGHIQLNHLCHRLRQKYLIIGGKAAISHVIRYCPACQKKDKIPIPQKKAVLPEQRLSFIWPFRNSALDALGPYEVSHYGRGI